MPAEKPPKRQLPAKTELLQLLAAAIDGVNGCESEHGDLRYWNEASIDRARVLLDSVEGDGGR